MLTDILEALRVAGRPLCLDDLSCELGVEPSALEGMLDTLIVRGRLRAFDFSDDGCMSCPVRGGCFIMNDGVARTYGLVPDRPAASPAGPSLG